MDNNKMVGANIVILNLNFNSATRCVLFKVFSVWPSSPRAVAKLIVVALSGSMRSTGFKFTMKIEN